MFADDDEFPFVRYSCTVCKTEFVERVDFYGDDMNYARVQHQTCQDGKRKYLPLKSKKKFLEAYKAGTLVGRRNKANVLTILAVAKTSELAAAVAKPAAAAKPAAVAKPAAASAKRGAAPSER